MVVLLKSISAFASIFIRSVTAWTPSKPLIAATMVAGSHTEVINSPVTVDRLWKSSLDAHNLIPKIMSNVISSIEILSGNGGVGTIKKFNFTDAAPGFAYVTEKTEVMDHDNHIFKYSVVDGGLIGKRVKSTSFQFKFEASADGGSVGIATMEYETLDGTDLSAEEKAKIFGGIVGMMKAAEGYLQANPDAYA